MQKIDKALRNNVIAKATVILNLSAAIRTTTAANQGHSSVKSTYNKNINELVIYYVSTSYFLVLKVNKKRRYPIALLAS